MEENVLNTFVGESEVSIRHVGLRTSAALPDSERKYEEREAFWKDVDGSWKVLEQTVRVLKVGIVFIGKINIVKECYFFVLRDGG